MELPADEFIRRFLHHVMPSGFNRIRYYGFLSNNNKELLARIQESLLAAEEETEPPSNEPKVYEGIPCTKCGTGVLMPFVIMDGCGNILNGDAQEFIEIRRERQHSFGREIVEVMDSS